MWKKIEEEKKIYVGTREVLQHRGSYSAWIADKRRGEIDGSHKKFTEKGAKRE